MCSKLIPSTQDQILHSNVVEPKTKCWTRMCVNQWQMVQPNVIPPISRKIYVSNSFIPMPNFYYIRGLIWKISKVIIDEAKTDHKDFECHYNIMKIFKSWFTNRIILSLFFINQIQSYSHQQQLVLNHDVISRLAWSSPYPPTLKWRNN